jgi:uncharacterized protein (DUF1501 family)
MGAAVKGGDVYGQFPTVAAGGPDDAVGNGTWIPTTSHMQYTATLAKWMGISTTRLSQLFPTLGLFPSADLKFLNE